MTNMLNNKRGFTLIEILVVMAISIILMWLVLYPVTQSLLLTRRAQAMVDAQDSARVAIEQMSRELGQAMYVYDNANSPVSLPIRTPGGSTTFVPLNFARVDFILPKIVMHCNNPDHPAGKPRDYPRITQDANGRTYFLAEPPCPYCVAANKPVTTDVEARPKLPLEQETTVVRYFLGLANNRLGPQPDGTHNYGWVSPWDKETVAGEENQVVLYRVEFSPYDESLFGTKPGSKSTSEWVAGNLADPGFFYSSDPAIADAWKRQARVIGIGKYEDLVVANQGAGGSVISVEPTVTFRTAAIDNDTFAGTSSNDASFEYPDAVPTRYSAAYGYWTPDNRVVVFRDDPATPNEDPYEVAYSTGIDPSNNHVIVYKWTNESGWVQHPHFDITEYVTTGKLESMTTDPLEMAFTYDPNHGVVDFSMLPPTPNGQQALCELDPAVINGDYRAVYKNDPASARRYWLLNTFDPGNSAQYLRNARIVPGSEKVVGPDMMPGFAGRSVRYERVPLALGDPGINQYKINYDTGEIYFSSVYEQDLPEGVAPILVDYRVYFNLKDDVVKGDYTTKSLINIHLGMRMFDPESGKAQPVDLSKSVRVRNALR